MPSEASARGDQHLDDREPLAYVYDGETLLAILYDRRTVASVTDNEGDASDVFGLATVDISLTPRGEEVVAHSDRDGRTTSETNREKGARNERQACHILGCRYRAERITTEHDPFHLADLMGLQEGYPFALVQVKTNTFTAEEKRHYRKWAYKKIDDEHTIFEVWVRKDRAGWEMHRLDSEERDFNCYFETSTCDPSEVRDGWRAAFMEVTDVAE